MNGQNSRSGPGPRPAFEGGQTPITKLFPKRGFVNPERKDWAPVNVDRLQHWIDEGRIVSSPENPITARELLLSGCVHNVHDGIKLLADGAENLKSPVHIKVSRASKSAIKLVEAAGGSVVCVHYNVLALRDCIKGRTDRLSAAPTRREDIMWYSDAKNRGYLAAATLSRPNLQPLVEPRWRMLSQQLGAWKKQSFAVEKK